jgi:hypothetical protein
MRRPVDTLIRGDHPRRQVPLERRERVEVLSRQAIVLRVFDARFGFAFGPRAVRGTRPRLHVPIAAEGQMRGMKDHAAGRAITAEDQCTRVITEEGARDPAEMLERRCNAFTPIILALIEKGFDEETARVTENGHEQEDSYPRAGDPHPLLPKIDL